MSASLERIRARAGRRIAAACRISAGGAAVEARALARHALACDDSELIMRGPEKPAGEELARFSGLVARRLRGEPVAHITGRREFYGLKLACSPAALIPRPETELVVDLALRRLPAAATGPAADLGTGSGAIACALAAGRPELAIDAYEADRQAAALARRNLDEYGSRIRIKDCSWEEIAPDAYRLIVANPPYLTSAETAAAIGSGDLRDPAAALDGGSDGFDGLRSAIEAAGRGLQDGCWLLVEHGADQQQAVSKLLARGGFDRIETHRDLAGLPRVAAGRRPGAS